MKLTSTWVCVFVAGVSACTSGARARVDEQTAPVATGSSQPPAPEDANCKGERPSPTHTCVQDCGPPVVQEGAPPPAWRWLSEEDVKARSLGGCPKCLPFDAPIDTPAGVRLVSELQIGDAIWSQDSAGRRIASVVARKGSARITSPHSFFTLVLEDGRRLRASGKHPLADGSLVALATVGTVVDGSPISSIIVETTDDGRTFDVRPATLQGTYWAGGVLVGSTLSP